MDQNSAAQAAEQAIKAAIRKAYDDGYNDAKMAPDNCSTYCVERAVRLDSAALLSKLRAPVADERAAFESIMADPLLALLGPGPASMRLFSKDVYDSDYVQSAWLSWQARATLASAPVAGEPFMYGIMGPDGKAHFEEFCVSGDRSELQTEVVDHLNRDNPEGGTYSVVALFRDAAPQASAGEAQPVAWRYQTPTGWHATTDAQKAVSLRAHHPVEPLYPKPQASAEDVRNAALEEAATVAKRISDKYAFGHYGNETDTADEIEREILALKTQADKDGGQQRAAFDHPVFAFLLGEGPLHGVHFGDRHPSERGAYWWRKDLRAALSATQAEQGERDE